MHNFNIFVNEFYLKTDCFVWFAIFWPKHIKVFFGLAHFFGLNSAINLWKTKFSLKIFGIFLTNKMRDKITILALFKLESILSYELYKKCRTL